MSTPNAPPDPVSKKKKGCSILWTIAAVAGIAVVAAGVATPKFLGFQCKSKKSEAKTNLSGLYRAEKDFFAKHGTYTTDLAALDWLPDGSPLYVYGFAKASDASAPAGLSDHDPTRRTTADPRLVEKGVYSARKQSSLLGRSFVEADFEKIFPAATATSAGFVAVAFGDIDTDGSEDLDVWTIDQDKKLTVIRNDCLQ